MNELFDFERALFPVWEGDTVYDESVTFVRSKNECSAPLLCKPDKILSVKNAPGNITYTEGTDYRLEDGKSFW